jgi:hypothetical protein
MFFRCLLVGLVLPACSLVSGTDNDPEPTASPASPAGSSSSSSSSSGNSGSPVTVTGNGKVKTEQREVTGFDRVSVGGIGQLIIEQTGEESLSIEAEENLLPLLVSEVEGGRLTIGIRRNTTINATRPIVYRLKVRTLQEIGANGTVSISATGLDTAQLSYDGSGTVKSILSGRAANQQVTISGTGSFDGRGLTGRTAEVDLSGTAEALVNVTETLKAKAAGTATIRYLSDPEVDRETSGLGKVERAQ